MTVARGTCPDCFTVFDAPMGLFRCPKCGWTLDKNAPRTPGTEIEPGLFIHPGTSDESKPVKLHDDGAYGLTGVDRARLAAGQERAAAVRRASREFFEAVVRALRIDRLVAWLDRCIR